jgi:hypothetical protein
MADDSSEIVKEQSESVAATNLKVLGDGPAFYSNLAMGNATQAQQAGQQLTLAIVSKAAEQIMATNPGEGAVDTALAQILAKIGQTTPPITAGGPVTGS